MKTRTVKLDVNLIRQSLTALLSDVGNMFGMDPKTLSLDKQVIIKRLAHEGLAFATKTLPNLGKHFDASLLSEYFTPIQSFKKDRKGNLPLFLNGLFMKVFAADGTILNDPDCDAIRIIRQLAYMFYKLELPFDDGLIASSTEEFVNVDQELRSYDSYGPEKSGIVMIASRIIGEIFNGFDPYDIKPAPGPGQNADRVPSEDRFRPRVLYKFMLDPNGYSVYEYFTSGLEHILDRRSALKDLVPLSTGISKLRFVPKDSRGPRIICMEPHEYMWYEQGLSRALVAHLERHPLTSGQVNFTDQSINSELAKTSSLTKEWATLDMKEASDRISNHLVDILFDEVPSLKKALMTLTTSHIELPDGRIIRKNKYASMGSALCFPVMSIVHYALALGSICLERGVSYKAIAKTVYVYGDDIICRTDDAHSLFHDFPLFGLKFNEKKSCHTGCFRESCGVDAFKGIDVTPLRVKKTRISYHDGTSLYSFLAVFHGLFNRGLWCTAKVYQNLICDIYGDLPCVTKHSSVPGWIVPRKNVFPANRYRLWRWHEDHQVIRTRVRTYTTPTLPLIDDPWERLLQYFVTSTERTGLVADHSNARLRWKWVPLPSL